MPYETILFERREARATITLNRPEALNALNVAMLGEVRDALDDIGRAGDARVLVLKGAGKAFCSGADIVKGSGANAGDGPFDGGRVLEDHINPLVERLAALPIPVVAAVSGAAAGAGCSLALAADFVVASRSSFFLMAFTKIGLVPDAGATWMIPRLVGLARAAEMLMLADRLPAETAASWGLIHRAVDDDQLGQAVDALADRLAAGPTRAYGLLRQALRQSTTTPLADSLRLERENQRTVGLGEDFAEGVKAFREKRPAAFKGR